MALSAFSRVKAMQIAGTSGLALGKLRLGSLSSALAVWCGVGVEVLLERKNSGLVNLRRAALVPETELDEHCGAGDRTRLGSVGAGHAIFAGAKLTRANRAGSGRSCHQLHRRIRRDKPLDRHPALAGERDQDIGLGNGGGGA